MGLEAACLDPGYLVRIPGSMSLGFLLLLFL